MDGNGGLGCLGTLGDVGWRLITIFVSGKELGRRTPDWEHGTGELVSKAEERLQRWLTEDDSLQTGREENS